MKSIESKGRDKELAAVGLRIAQELWRPDDPTSSRRLKNLKALVISFQLGPPDETSGASKPGIDDKQQDVWAKSEQMGKDALRLSLDGLRSSRPNDVRIGNRGITVVISPEETVALLPRLFTSGWNNSFDVWQEVEDAEQRVALVEARYDPQGGWFNYDEHGIVLYIS